ncbi:MAG: DNA translocase FtsK [Chloroflexi bacterium]|nr:MAG: DNA translocase FtsK [Chloroflexota bacterium]MBL1193387.1 DNA translocase FtsK [Chloroflexota bacterium]NOH10679.1 DNA translocase FtsK [Chloroflexota bacterium]
MAKKEASSKMTRDNGPDGLGEELLGRGLGFLLRFRRFAWDIAGIVSIALAGLTLLALFGESSGAWLTPWARILRLWFGWGSLLVVLSFALGGLVMLNRRREELFPRLWARVISLELAGFAFLALLTISISIFLGEDTLIRAEQGLDGGRIGWSLIELLGLIFSAFPAVLSTFLQFTILLLIFVLGTAYGTGLLGWAVGQAETALSKAASVDQPVEFDVNPVVSVSPAANSEPVVTPEKKATSRKRTYIPPEYRKQFQVEEREEATVASPPRDNRLPPLDLLVDEQGHRHNERHINQTAGLIEKTLAEFSIPAKVVDVQVGPTVTQFAVEPGYIGRGEDKEENANNQKVRVSQIAGLQRDLALALSAQRLRIQAPVPGKPYVGVEVPNLKSAEVRLRPILEGEGFYKLKSQLGIALGRDVSGTSVSADLSKMPHLLIAGTTGSGKSVCIAAIAVSLIMNNTPEDLRLVMIDPKMVELVPFNGLPHLYGKVETDLERIAGVLRWVLVEMERRYKLLEDMRSRDISSYNNKARRKQGAEVLPRIVVLIDELADLMMSAAESTEATLVRLAQMARATGIHLVVATQRPSTDVVTGLIKANFPARISFAVASGIDSRVILDTPGAENLLGKGDMLYMAPEAAAPLRSQGVLITDKEIEKIIAYWRKTWSEGDEGESPWDELLARQDVLADRDDLIEAAIEVVRETGKASASHLQRQLRVGYPRAARLVDELEDLGILGPSRGGGRDRDILIDVDGDMEMEHMQEE